ncbi:hypothetical protein KQI42_03775 [Tissierella sp. MSJ-40]|uniref:Uncharacterized protein n=1 Tax=Tissierella simiarum TaxID=2841534 RepID=A0ABS6E2J2_9FIRM|nr:glycosyltransferase [Tissierella simiarum]MBU5437114.1 hypothetical protein [Tissierella simiarum]
MKDRIDILILTANFGQGHISVSKGIKENILKIDPSINIEIADLFQIFMPKLSKNMYKGYGVLVKSSPEIYNHFYYKKNKESSIGKDQFSYKYNLNKLQNYLIKLQPKMIISTFPGATYYISKLKEHPFFSFPLITCITDVVSSWEWIVPNCDKYFVATEEIKERMIEKGVQSEKIVTTGIPLRREFIEENKPVPNITLPKDGLVMMIMGGGMGLLPKNKNFYNWLNNLEGVTTLVLTGKNEELLEKLIETDMDRVIPVGYIEEVAYLMDKCDLLITKAGGVTVFEAIASNLPLIVYKPKLGQEIENTNFIEEESIGRIAFSMKDLQWIVEDLINNREKIKNYKRNIDALKKYINMNRLAEESIKLLYS